MEISDVRDWLRKSASMDPRQQLNQLRTMLDEEAGESTTAAKAEPEKTGFFGRKKESGDDEN